MTDADERTVAETVTSVLTEHPVSVGYLFGSYARGEADSRSDIDVAVVFDDCDPGDPGHADRRLALGVDLALAFETDDVDVVDMQAVPLAVRRSVISEGTRLIGTEDEAEKLRDRLLTDDTETQSPADRFDEALAAIDEHFA